MHAALWPALSVGPSVHRSVGPSVHRSVRMFDLSLFYDFRALLLPLNRTRQFSRVFGRPCFSIILCISTFKFGRLKYVSLDETLLARILVNETHLFKDEFNEVVQNRFILYHNVFWIPPRYCSIEQEFWKKRHDLLRRIWLGLINHSLQQYSMNAPMNEPIHFFPAQRPWY